MKKATEFFPLGPGTLTYKRQWTQAETTELGTKGNKRYVSSHWNRQVVQSPSLENQGTEILVRNAIGHSPEQPALNRSASNRKLD